MQQKTMILANKDLKWKLQALVFSIAIISTVVLLFMANQLPGLHGSVYAG